LDPEEPSYVQRAVSDLADYLKEITGARPPIASSLDTSSGTLLAVGKKVCERTVPRLLEGRNLDEEGFIIKSVDQARKICVAVAGATPRGTNCGLATLMSRIRVEDDSVRLEGPSELQSTPRFALRGIHLNGWPINYPYAFRAWQESDWQRFIDLVWLQRANLLLLWPSFEILPFPLSPEDEAYLQEVRRVVDYAQTQRGLEIWIMHSANRIAVSNCGVRDPRPRPYWVDKCQKDMNPADPQQADRVMKSLEACYQVVNNPEGFCMIDSDPGGWPQSPISDQLKIFKGVRALLDRHNLHGTRTKLIDWMWVGWGRHKFLSSSETAIAQYDWTEKNPDASDKAFMGETLRNFKQNLPEPWGLISGFPQYLETCRKEGTLAKTVFMPYGVIEIEPAFPATNVPLNPVRGVFESLNDFPNLKGIMGNNQTPLLQLPRTYYFLRSAWDSEYRKQSDREVLLDLAEQLHPNCKELISDSFEALEETDAQKIHEVLSRLATGVEQKHLGRPGALGRRLFPDQFEIARNLVFQLKIRLARQRLIQSLGGKPSRDDCERLVETYLDALLAWDQETGWEKLVRLGIWRSAFFPTDRKFTETLSILKRVLAGDSEVAPYAAIASFFNPIRKRLLEKYREDSVMIGCIEPLKIAVIQAP
jgi:hypothetical protein